MTKKQTRNNPTDRVLRDVELLPTYEDIVTLTNAAIDSNAKVAAMQLEELSNALDESYDVHAILFATKMFDAASKGEGVVDYTLSETFDFNDPSREEISFAYGCVDDVTARLCDSLDKRFDVGFTPSLACVFTEGLLIESDVQVEWVV